MTRVDLFRAWAALKDEGCMSALPSPGAAAHETAGESWVSGRSGDSHSIPRPDLAGLSAQLQAREGSALLAGSPKPATGC